MSDRTPRPARGSPPRTCRRATCALAALLCATSARAEEGETVRHIADNSFLVEEAYNQEDGVVHNTASFVRDRDGGDWVTAVTQEWPVVNEEHQLSYTVVLSRVSDGNAVTTGVGDLQLGYRYQLLSDDAPFTVAPRLSAILPTGDGAKAMGFGGYGVQVNLPASVEVTSWLVSHTNAGMTWVPRGRVRGEDVELRSYTAGEGLVVRLHPRFNLLVETLFTRSEVASGGATSRTHALTVSPGFQTAFNFANGLQVVTGLGVPLGVGPSAGSLSVLGYLSFEFPFTEAGKLNAPAGPVRSRPPVRAVTPGRGDGEPDDAVASGP